ncbi:MAG: CAP domain-containing protein [Egibacteraceae bacterium]
MSLVLPRLRTVVVALLLVALLVPAASAVTASPAAAATRRDRAEALLVRKLNTARVNHDRRRVRVKAQIRHDVARPWSKRQARTGVLAHNPRYASQITGNWRRAGENVAYIRWPKASLRKKVNRVHRMLMQSPGHRANILGRYNRVGVGVRFDPAGRMWITQNFAKF